MIKSNNNWNGVLRTARRTVGKSDLNKEPSSEWKTKILFAEHSCIRKIHIEYVWEKIKSWVSVHFVRHKFGIEHWVRSQRDDRTGEDRDSKRQDTIIEHEIEVNAQEIINISRKRLCTQAHRETQNKWLDFLSELNKIEPEIVKQCVPECVYRNGLCPEIKSCGFNKLAVFKEILISYIEPIKDQVV